MKLISKTLLAGAAALLLAPMSAVAAPRDCGEVCKPTGSCNWLCDNGGDVITCGEYGLCSGASPVAPSEPQAAAQPKPSEELVCRAPAAKA
ncbi:MAG: hypothetical protein EOO71_09840 [Myxococcaceae bacterium]|nr:MAG: hypothetical protein EOO71_09840 [Myxococcaceae bacterium]